MLLYLLISAHTMWWGGWAYGPRHLTVVAVLFFATGLPLVPKHRGWTLLACTVGTLGAVLAIAAKSTVWGAFPSDVYDPISHVLVPALEQGAWSTMQLPVTFGLAPGRSAAMFAALFAAAVAGLVVLERDPKHQP
jgi:hypothetical protein